jgi:hypothetical protein
MILKDGTIEIESPRVIITPKTTREDFLASPLFSISEPRNQNTPWSRYAFKPITVGSEQFAAYICFCWGHIYSASLCSMRSEFGTWNINSGIQEAERHYFHKEFLQKIFDRPPDETIRAGIDVRDASAVYNFPWGLVCAEQDIKCGASFILIKYGNL